jgi:hypothetical protein
MHLSTAACWFVFNRGSGKERRERKRKRERKKKRERERGKKSGGREVMGE